MSRGKSDRELYVLTQEELTTLANRRYQGQRVTEDGIIRTWLQNGVEIPEHSVVLQVVYPRPISDAEVGTDIATV